MLVRTNPQATVLLQAHVMEHISLLARQMVEAENQEQLQAEAAKFGGKIPPELQAQFQEEMERQISLKATEFIEEMFIEEQQSMEGQGQDPLVGLKQQELQLKAQDIQRKAQNDQQKLDLEGAKLDQSAKIAQDKIDSNEDIAQLRANVNLDKQNAKNDNSNS
jgi:ABC-type thiamine transport system substrate-binding protein